jgi:hypothetical protein
MNSHKHRRAMLAVAAAVTLGSLASAAPAMASGAFVLGDNNAAIGTTVTFWGAQWWKDEVLSGGLAPAAFKGYADSATATCGQTWTTLPGNSSSAPTSVSGLVPMVVASHITQDGNAISGDTAEVVLVQVDGTGYESNPGHAGTGTVVRIVCGGGGT